MGSLLLNALKADVPSSITMISHFPFLGHHPSFTVHRGWVACAYERLRAAWVVEVITKLYPFRWEKGPKGDSAIISDWSFPRLYIYQWAYWEAERATFQMARRTTGGQFQRITHGPLRCKLPKQKSGVIFFLSCSFIGQGLYIILRVCKCSFTRKWH